MNTMFKLSFCMILSAGAIGVPPLNASTNAGNKKQQPNSLIEGFNAALASNNVGWLEENERKLLNSGAVETEDEFISIMTQLMDKKSSERQERPQTTCTATTNTTTLTDPFNSQLYDYRRKHQERYLNQQKEKAEAEKKEKMYRDAYLDQIKDKKLPQDMVKLVASLYYMLTEKNDGHQKLLKDISTYQNAQKIYDALTHIAQTNTELMNIVGQEIQAIRGNMIHGTWQSPEKINPTDAFEAFKKAISNSARNNLFTTVLKNSEYETQVMEIIINKIYIAMNNRNTEELMELYFYFVQDSAAQDDMLAVLYEFALNNLITNKDITNLKKIRICFASDEEFYNLINSEINDLEFTLEMGPSVAPERTYIATLYHGFQAARDNHDTESLINLAPIVAEAGLIEQTDLLAINQSIIGR